MKYKNDVYRQDRFGNIGQSGWDAKIEAPLWQWIIVIVGVGYAVAFIIKAAASV